MKLSFILAFFIENICCGFEDIFCLIFSNVYPWWKVLNPIKLSFKRGCAWSSCTLSDLGEILWKESCSGPSPADPYSHFVLLPFHPQLISLLVHYRGGGDEVGRRFSPSTSAARHVAPPRGQMVEWKNGRPFSQLGGFCNGLRPNNLKIV